MAVRDALNLLQFWFSVDSFKKATSSVSKETTPSLTSSNHTAPSLQHPHSNIVSIIEGICEPNIHSPVVDHSSSSNTSSLLSQETTIVNCTVEPSNRVNSDISNDGSLNGGMKNGRDDNNMMMMMANSRDPENKPLADLTRQHSLSE